MPTATATAIVEPTARIATRTHGRVLWFSPKGFGMIAAEDGTDVYVHHSGIDGDGFRSLPTDAHVSFVIDPAARGPEAIDVRLER
jgi:CspA family cold shock protein